MTVIEHPLTSDDRAAAADFRVAALVSKGKLSGPAGRPRFDEILERTPDAPDVNYEVATVGEIRGVWCRPLGARSDVAILYLHGGAYVLGSAWAFRHFVGQIAARCGLAAFIADYRRAPEHAFPAAVDDAAAAYRGLVELGLGEVVVIGDSAGGGLALATLATAQRDAVAGRGRGALAGMLISPWTDLAQTGASIIDRADADPLLTEPLLSASAKMYLGDHPASDPRASPLFGEPLRLPPLMIHVGTNEILLDDTLRYVERAAHDGTAVTAHVWEGMPHVFLRNVGIFAAATAALDLVATFVTAQLTHASTAP